MAPASSAAAAAHHAKHMHSIAAPCGEYCGVDRTQAAPGWGRTSICPHTVDHGSVAAPHAAVAGNRHGRHRGRPGTGRRALRIIARSAIGLASVVVVTLTGLAYSQAHGLLSGITVSQALGSDEPRSSGGAMNILLIGLDSRKDQAGSELPDELLEKLHAGDSDSGGYNTNTLILVHISADDQVVAFSIPVTTMSRSAVSRATATSRSRKPTD